MKILKIIADFFRSLFCKKSTEQTASSPEASPAQTPCEEAKAVQTTEAQPEQQPATDAPSVSDAAPGQSATSDKTKSDNDDNTIPQAQTGLFNQIAAYFKQILKVGKQNAIKVSVIDGPCNFSDFLAWFKSKNIDQKKHTPFIIKITPENAKMFNILPELTKPVGIMLGIYDKSDDTFMYQAIQCDALDQRTTDVLGNEMLVILS